MSSLAVIFAMLGCGDDNDPKVALIPAPAEATIAGGALVITASARIVAAGEAAPVAELLAAALRPATGYSFTVVAGEPISGDIALRLDTSLDTGGEGYELTVGQDGVTIAAAGAAGLFYGSQTLRQLFPPAIENSAVIEREWTLPRVVIRDRPRFAWRGFMLDVARHFFSVATIERLIDLAAYHKLNRFHLHLTDDQGWRIHIDSWPKLTEIGGATEVGGGSGGFYTKADYARIVAYAQARFVTVVPEIDMPGHVNAALASYGELNESGVPAEPYTGIDVGFTSLWIDGPSTLSFVQDVLGEIAAMTPGPWIHVGGDEAQATSTADYTLFMSQVQQIVAGQGKQMIAWEEIAGANLTGPFIGQHWLRDGDARDLAAQGAPVIVSPATHAYLDMKYDSATELGVSYVGFTDVDKAYQWDPVDDDLGPDDVLGVEAPLWTETIETPADIDFMVFPRLAGHAEIGWSPAERDWFEYRERLAHHGRRLDAMGVGFYRSIVVDWSED